MQFNCLYLRVLQNVKQAKKHIKAQPFHISINPAVCNVKHLSENIEIIKKNFFTVAYFFEL